MTASIARSSTAPAGSREPKGYRGHVSRAFAEVLRNHGLHVHPARLRQLVSDYVRTGRPAEDVERYFLSYADPTGEQAVRRTEKTAQRCNAGRPENK